MGLEPGPRFVGREIPGLLVNGEWSAYFLSRDKFVMKVNFYFLIHATSTKSFLKSASDP